MRLRQLDGIRTLAIFLVFSQHAFNLNLGWAGVDLFFVLSGFLITRILREGREKPAYWSLFYIKRATRIVPPLVLCVVLSALVFHLGLHRLWWAYLLFAANFAIPYSPASALPVGILWSLAVEEHFYLLWPFAVRFLTRRHLISLLVACLVLEPIFRAAATPFLPFMSIYLLTPFRLDGLAAGSLLALGCESSWTTDRVSRIAGPLCLGATATFVVLRVLIPSFTRSRNTFLFNSLGYSLIVLIAVSLIAFVMLKQRSLLSRLLASRLPARLGVISYGVYLFHLLALAIAGRIPMVGTRRVLLVPVAFALVVVFSSLSFRFYESPFMRWGHRLATRWSLPPTGTPPRTSSAPPVAIANSDAISLQ